MTLALSVMRPPTRPKGPLSEGPSVVQSTGQVIQSLSPTVSAPMRA